MSLSVDSRTIQMYLKLCFLTAISIWCLSLSGQTYILNGTSNNTTVNTCAGTFTDSGGSGGDYQNDEDYTITFCSDNGGQLSFDFESFFVEDFFEDFYVYDGPNMGAPQLTGSPFMDDELNGQVLISSGTCMTFRFVSDFSIIEYGWEATIDCITPCQEIVADLSNTNPAQDPTTGETLLCGAEEINFSATGIYTQNNLNYAQSDATSTFTWNFGDGEIVSGQEVNHIYDDGGNYTATLTIEDINGCEYDFVQPIFVSPPPSFVGTNVLEEEICLGSSNVLSGFVEGNMIAAIECEYIAPTFLGLIDNNNAVDFSAPLTFDCYADGATLDSMDDLEGICMNIEHSWVGDLAIEMSCPNGQSVTLLENTFTTPGNLNLGVPAAVGTGPGTGEDYCFVFDSPTYDWLSIVNANTDVAQPSGNYTSSESLEGLLGCPLNGVWTLTVIDEAGGDNGYLFGWSVDINPDLLDVQEETTQIIETEEWISDPTITTNNGSEIIVTPEAIGESCYTYLVTDDTGCSYDTTLCFNVVPSGTNLAIDPVVPFCENDPIYIMTTNIPGGSWTGDVNADGSFDPSIGNGTYTGTYSVGVGSCTVSESIDLIVNSAPTAIISGSTNICEGESTVIQVDFVGDAPFVFEYLLDGVGQGEITTTENPYQFNTTTAGVYTLNYLSNDLCTGSVSGTAEVLNSTSPEAINIVETCSDDLLTYTIGFEITGGENTTYQVDGGGAVVGSAFTSTPISNGDSYSFVVYDANNCDQFEVSGSYNCGCIASASLGADIEICEGSVGNLQIDFTGVGPWTFEYLLDGLNPTELTTTDNPYSLAVEDSGTYTILSVSDINCEGSVSGSSEVLYNTSPEVINIVETCSADLLSYSISFDIIGGDNQSYQVTGAGTLMGSSFTSDPIENGTPYSYLVNDGNNCVQQEVSGTYYCGCITSATLSGDYNICPGSVVEVPIALVGEGPWTIEYVIDGGPSEIVSTSDNPYLLNIYEESTVTLLGVEDVNCVGEVSGEANIYAIDPPTAITSGNFELCDGEEAIIEVEFTGEGPWELTYQLNSDLQPPINVTTPTFGIVTNVMGSYELISVSDANCTSEAEGSANVEVHDLPQAVIDGSLFICEDSPGVVVVDLIGSPGFILSYSHDGVPQGPVTSDQPDQFEFFIEESGTYELLSIQDLYCVGYASGSIDVDIAPLPTAAINGEELVCEGAEVFFPITLTGNTEWTIDYSIDGESQPAIVTNDPNFQLPGTLEGEYEITQVSDLICNNEGEGIAVLEFYPPIQATFSEGQEACYGESIDLWASATGGIGAPYSYDWILDDVVTSSDSSVTIFSESSTNIQATITDGCDYTLTIDVPIVINELPSISIDGIQSNCGPGFLELSNNTPSYFLGNNCTWTINNESFTNCSPSVTHYFAETGTYDINLEIESPEGCYNSELFEGYVEIYPLPEAEFSFDDSDFDLVNNYVHFTNESSIDVVNSFWQFGDDGESSETNSQFEFPIDDGPKSWPICLAVENSFGCADTTCYDIIMKPTILSHIPNSFTPDEDGLNDFFYPVLFGVEEDSYEFLIYDRTGNLVFKSNDIHGKWNGSYMNKKEYYTKDGMYSWQIKAKLIGSTDVKLIQGAVLVTR